MTQLSPSKAHTSAMILLLACSSASLAQDLQDNQAYAIMQDCMAGAEQTGNLGSQLDRYCITSYLATRSDYQLSTD